jgi:glycosyltransferase involved in cell wall biosynthesis
MRKIAIFQTDLNYGGIQKSLINMLNSIDYKNNEVDLYLFKGNHIFINDINSHVNIKYLNIKYNSIMALIPFRIIKLIIKFKIDKKYDLAIDFNGYNSFTSAYAIKCNAKKHIIWVHNDYLNRIKYQFKFRILFFLSKSKYKYYNKYVYVSNGVKNSFNKLINTNNKEEIIIPNIINTKEIFELSNNKSDIKVDTSITNLCYVGRLVHQKGIDLLLTDFSEVIKENTKYHLYIIGGGNILEELKDISHKLEIDSYVTFVGYQKNPYSIMKEMDALVLTSHFEGQGMVLLEAKSLGLDVVIPKHLEQYVESIKGTDNIKESILKLKKHKHIKDNLDDYNNKIINSINNL